MTISFNTPSTKLSSADGTSATFAHSSNGKPLIIAIALRGVVSNVTATFNGVSATKKIERLQRGFYYVAMFYLDAPANGSYNVVVSWTGSAGYCAAAVNVSGADAPINELANGADSGLTASVNITSDTGSLVVDAVSYKSIGTLTVGAGQTSLVNVINTGGSLVRLGMSYETGQTTTTMSWGSSTDNEWSIAGMSFKETIASNGFFHLMT